MCAVARSPFPADTYREAVARMIRCRFKTFPTKHGFECVAQDPNERAHQIPEEPDDATAAGKPTLGAAPTRRRQTQHTAHFGFKSKACAAVACGASVYVRGWSAEGVLTAGQRRTGGQGVVGVYKRRVKSPSGTSPM
ncbi:hypothetical protein ISCGN_016313 [Ixodes scapularis]